MILNRVVFLLALLVGAISANVTYSYSYVPKQVYATQVFPVTILANSNDGKSSPAFTFSGGSSEPLNHKPIRDINGENTFYTFYFKALSEDLKTPTIQISDKESTATLPEKYISVKKLDTTGHDDFCGLIATDCKILTSQVSTFDGKNNMISITIKASEANPREMFTKNAIEHGIEKIKTTGSWVTAEYYFILPSSTKSITASYYNSVQHRFINKTIVTDFKLNPVAAQESLNPIDSSFKKIKKYGMVLLTLILLLLYMWRNDTFYLVFLILAIFILVYIFWPTKSICIQEGGILYILPTETSTTGGMIENRYETSELSNRGSYHKIEYKNGIIGWVKDEDLCKN